MTLAIPQSPRPGTPPWHYRPGGDADGCGTGVVTGFVLDADGTELACPPTAAVARLMAAAPDLLAACGEALQLCMANGYGRGRVQALLLAAIDRATGHPPRA